MKITASVSRLQQDIAQRFPECAREIDRRMHAVKVPGPDAAIWLQEFSRCVTDSVRRRDARALAAQLSFVADRVAAGDEAVGAQVELSFVEPLMWSLDAESRAWGWAHMPSNLQKMYAAMWGIPAAVAA